MNRKLRVLVDASSALHGGGVTFAAGSLSGLAAKGVDLHVVAPDSVKTTVASSVAIQWVKPPRIKLFRIMSSVFFSHHVANRVGADVVLFLGNYGLSWGSVPTVVVAQLDPKVADWYAWHHLVGQMRWFVLKLLMRVSYNKAKFVASVSQALAAELVATFGLNGSRVVVIGEGVTSRPLPQALVGAEVFAITGAQKYKGGRTLSVALTRIANQFGITPRLAGVSLETAKALGWSGTEGEIDWLGHLSHDEVLAHYRNSRVFVYQSHVEAFGLPPLEAMAAGVAVAAPDLPAIREVCGEAALFFDPSNEVDMAQAVSRLLSDEKLRSTLTFAGLKRAEQFKWEKVAERLLEVLYCAVDDTNENR